MAISEAIPESERAGTRSEGPSEGAIEAETPRNSAVERDRSAVRAFVEDYAMLLEGEGLPRMAGRIFAWLQVCDPPEQTAADLSRQLNASVGSISSMTRLLVSAELIERVSRPGERADRFRITPDGVTTLMRSASARLSRFRRITARGLDVLADRPPASRERLEAFHDLYVYFEKAFPAVVDDWERQRKEVRR